ncbi:hypothetical protein H9X85_04675 [Anaerotignum lactatifermentans]|uniref:Conjugal transfer protein TraX n=1 Tax=Anaerotignum lactatifermentans TaxID=160404 RepID=A0ABS2G665_9FIRM|nr:TraX family protein [Anaerotignum lactatifermentans]MBM6828881.1 hypothetical protein [Anaerotignum lactatifermentans]MBM6876946.1 hypothetical protein [Anaerotignum lactatifermentans]MBM6950504.1 hypothetical protein [Anaerotignum lactatifermentans]
MAVLNGNALKILALLIMTIDHIGYILCDNYMPFRIIGRIAFPIFAYMIAEGCRYTRNRKHHLLLILGLGILFQLVLFLVEGSLAQCIFITFSFSMALIFSMDFGRSHKGLPAKLLFPLCMVTAYFFCEILPLCLGDYDFSVDYHFFGVLLPLFIYLGNTREQKLLLAAIGLVLVNLQYGGIQWFSLAALPLLALYNGQRGKWRLKYLFYIYYPLHLSVIWGIDYILS